MLVSIDHKQENNLKSSARDSFDFVSSFEELHHIKSEALNMAILKRHADEGIKKYISQINLNEWDNLKIELKKNELDDIDQFEEMLPESGYMQGRKALVDDAKLLTRNYFEISSEVSVRVNLSLIDYNMCRLFHTDQLALRLLCTYHGQTTEWLDNENAMRSGLAQGCNSKIVRDMDKIRRMNIFDVGLLKGDAYPATKKLGVIHRSPMIEGTNKPWRVLIKIDSSNFGHGC